MDENWLAVNYHRTRQEEILDAMVAKRLISAAEKRNVVSGHIEVGMSEAAILAVHGVPQKGQMEWRDELLRADGSRRVIFHYQRVTYYVEGGTITAINRTD